jgi:hypothetical protein
VLYFLSHADPIAGVATELLIYVNAATPLATANLPERGWPALAWPALIVRGGLALFERNVKYFTAVDR